MSEDEVKEILSDRKQDDRENGFNMMATKAYHQMGDISRDEPQLCFIYSETKDYWVGQWCEGFGFFNVLFPKDTTRYVTKEEVEEFNGRQMYINSRPIGKLEVTTRI